MFFVHCTYFVLYLQLLSILVNIGICHKKKKTGKPFIVRMMLISSKNKSVHSLQELFAKGIPVHYIFKRLSCGFCFSFILFVLHH